jgi:hypothetical protein
VLAVATSALSQPDECRRMKDVRGQAENQFTVLLGSPLRTDAEMFAAAVNRSDPWPAAQARRQFEVPR